MVSSVHRISFLRCFSDGSLISFLSPSPPYGRRYASCAGSATGRRPSTLARTASRRTIGLDSSGRRPGVSPYSKPPPPREPSTVPARGPRTLPAREPSTVPARGLSTLPAREPSTVPAREPSTVPATALRTHEPGRDSAAAAALAD